MPIMHDTYARRLVILEMQVIAGGAFDYPDSRGSSAHDLLCHEDSPSNCLADLHRESFDQLRRRKFICFAAFQFSLCSGMRPGEGRRAFH